MSTEFELFPGKSLGGLFKDIYDNQQTKKLRISELIAEMRKLVRHSQDMMAMGPIIRDLIDSSVRNDDSLIKMAAIAQRIIGNNQKSEGDSGFLSNDEKEQLLKELDQTISEVSNEHDIKLDDITNEVEELKLKVGKNG
tara:strand:- start:839 stop:1255 length:417 start_codon:yes stop_codon:yes gene_type:complete